MRAGRAVLAVLICVMPGLASAATLNTPTALAATAASGSAITLTWSDSNRASQENYVAIERGTDGTTFTQISTVPNGTTTYQNSGLTSWVRYYYRVKAVGNGNSFSLYSNVASAQTPDTIPPSVPASISASAVSCSQINLAWSASTDGQAGLRGYNVYRAGVFISQVAAPATSIADTGLNAATAYSYTVAAID